MRLTEYSTLIVYGRNIKQFCNSQFTADLSNCRNNMLRSAYLNDIGRIVSTFFIHFVNEHAVITLPKELSSKFVSQLEHYGKFNRIKIAVKNSFPILTNQPRSDHSYKINEQYLHFSDQSFNCDLNNIFVKNNIIEITAATSTKVLVAGTNLVQENIVSSSKGCYLGQEIVNRSLHRAKAKYIQKKLPVDGFKLLEDLIIYKDNKKVGQLILSSEQRAICLINKEQSGDAIIIAGNNYVLT